MEPLAFTLCGLPGTELHMPTAKCARIGMTNIAGGENLQAWTLGTPRDHGAVANTGGSLVKGAIAGLVLGAASALGGHSMSGRRRTRHHYVRGSACSMAASTSSSSVTTPASPVSNDVPLSKPADTAPVAQRSDHTVGVPLACPVCQQRITRALGGAMECIPCDIAFPKQQDGNFQDLTIVAGRPRGELPLSSSAVSEETEEPGLLQKLPFVQTADALAKALGLPQSKELEALAKDVLREGPFLRRSQPLSVSTFQNPVVSFSYERGWRQQFASSGFPGPEEEFKLAQNFLAETSRDGNGILLDASCGSGLFSRRFANSGAFQAVVALDFSESMLRQVNAFARRELGAKYDTPVQEGGNGLVLVRGDIGRLPFANDSLDGVHASAAIHCWPSPENGVAEIARVLKPGGVLVLSTFTPASPLNVVNQGNGGVYRFWKNEELRSLTRQCGLVDFKAIERQPAFIMVRVRKPALT